MNRTRTAVLIDYLRFGLRVPAAAMVVFALVGCATDKPAKTLPPFGRIAIESSDTVAYDLHADSTSQKAATGVVGGAAGGAVTGATLGLACGPFAFFCVPVAAIAGGVAAGITAGIFNGLDGLPAERAAEVTDVLSRLDEGRDFAAEAHAALMAAVPPTRQGERGDADARVVLSINRIDLRQYGHDRLALRVVASMTVEWTGGDRRAFTQTNRYEYETGEERADDWLYDDGARFDAGVSECIERVVRQMARDLTGPTWVAS